ncbi:Pre-mRNA-splicing factor CWC22-like [Cricetulus griseus]|uniref:Pre-mRNA-splicing factor CWC22 homolog n=1 Tax=Cricetulus griseus TaxID=10029 RepID=G3HAC9_CRIGR|nr:Pre-mRNA-splicing factor CWC22-like [Cricetulus griseus]
MEARLLNTIWGLFLVYLLQAESTTVDLVPEKISGFWKEVAVASDQNLVLKTQRRIEGLFLIFSGRDITVKAVYNKNSLKKQILTVTGGHTTPSKLLVLDSSIPFCRPTHERGFWYEIAFSGIREDIAYSDDEKMGAMRVEMEKNLLALTVTYFQYAEQERSPRDRDYSDYSRSDYERSRRGYSYDDSVESRSRDREKRRERERDVDRKSLAYQRMSWEALKKSINGLINKVNISNISIIIQELLQENIVRGRGLLSRSVLQAQSASPIFTHVYAALVAIINSKFPQIGELILKRLILNFRKGYRRNDKQLCLTASKFVAHLINQNVAHEVLCLEMLTLLLERPTDDSVEVAIGFLKECGLKLTQVSPRGINAIFERLRNILHESEIDKRVQYMIEVMFAVRKDGFKDHPVILEGLDLVEEDDQFTHMLPLEDDYNPEDVLNVFKMDPNFMENEEKYKAIKKGQKVTIHDKTEINLVSFRRTIYLAIQSSLDFEECAHKLLKMEFAESQTRFCMLKKEYMESFESIFKEQYDTIHRLETNKLRNVAKMFAHLLYTDSLPWSVLECIKLSEETTTSSSRIFVKIFFQELCEYMGLPKLNARLKDETLQPFFEGLLPRDNPRNTRFAINFFTSIGLGGLTDELREHLKNTPKVIVAQKPEGEQKKPPLTSSSSASSSESDSSESDSDSSESSSDSSSEGSDSSSSSSQSSASAKDTRKKKRGKARSEEVEKVVRGQQTRDRRREGGREEQRHQEGRTDRERSDRHRAQNSRNADCRDPLAKYMTDRSLPSQENSYSRVGNGRDQDMHRELEDKHGELKKKRRERRDSFSENEKQRTRNQDSESVRRKHRSKSRERSRKHSGHKSDDDRYQNGAERRWEKSTRYSEHSRESKRNQDRRREKSPTRQK